MESILGSILLYICSYKIFRVNSPGPILLLTIHMGINSTVVLMIKFYGKIPKNSTILYNKKNAF